MGGEVGANIQKIFSYGHRNSFGMAVDPVSGEVWLQENGDDTFSEMNRVEPGMNGGWIQIAGPVASPNSRKSKQPLGRALQHYAGRPRILDTPKRPCARLFMLPGAKFIDPEFSWKWEMAPGGHGLCQWRQIWAPQFEGDLFMGRPHRFCEGGYLLHFN